MNLTKEKMVLKQHHLRKYNIKTLLAIIIRGNWSMERSMAVVQGMMDSFDNDPSRFMKANIAELESVPGMTKGRAGQLFHMIAWRNFPVENAPLNKITGSGDIYKVLSPLLADLEHEVLYLVCLGSGNTVNAVVEISSGSYSSTIGSIPHIVREAVLHASQSVVLGHNHPSGLMSPSDEDIRLTGELKEAMKILDINLIDHLIIGRGGDYCSFADEGIL